MTILTCDRGRFSVTLGGTYMMYKPIVEKIINTTNQLNQYLEYKFSTPESVGSIMQNGW